MSTSGLQVILVVILLALVPGIKNTLYGVDEAGIVYYCPSDHVAFQVDLASALPLFGASVTTMYMSNLGFLSDVYNDYETTPVKFPLSGSSGHAAICAGVRCWLDYYYSATEVEEIEAQNHPDDCVHGESLTDVFNYMEGYDYLQPIDSPSRTLSPENCFESNVEPPERQDFNWMIAAYWQNLDVRFMESIMSHLETTNTDTLDQIQQDVEALESVSSFVPTRAVIFTWTGISFYNGFYYGYPEADFQIVLATDETDTYAVYNYDTLTFGGAQAGFDAGDNNNYCSLMFSRSEKSSVWTQLSNIGVEGRVVLKMGDGGLDSSVCEPYRDGVPSCVCEEGWEGTICASSIDECLDHTCSAEAACVDGHLGYTCDFCDGVTCENEGVCVSNEDTESYQCDCVGIYTGEHCQCAGLTCENGGVCTHNADTGEDTCTCVNGYSGTTCQNNFCIGVTCQHEGVCVGNETGQSYHCECVGVYTGDLCEQCVDLSCDNGGVCSNDAASGESTCTCADEYSGSTCQIAKADQLEGSEEAQSDNELTGGEIAAIAVGATAGLAGLGTLIYLVARKKKNEEDKVEPEDRSNVAWATHA